jgi:hypothetical protein
MAILGATVGISVVFICVAIFLWVRQMNKKKEEESAKLRVVINNQLNNRKDQ